MFPRFIPALAAGLAFLLAFHSQTSRGRGSDTDQAASAAGTSANLEVQAEENVAIAMRDGTELAANVFRPATEGRFPTLIVRTPYGKGDLQNEQARQYAARGYAFVVQDCRGTGQSPGAWEPGVNEPNDGLDTHRWVLQQPWCNGRLGTAGGSYVGYTQWAVAPRAEDALQAMCTVVPLFDWHEGAYTGGAFQLQTLMTWGTMMTRPAAGQERLVDPQTWNWDQALRYLPLSTWDEQIGAEIPWMRAWVAHPTYDAYWAKSRIIDKLDRIRAANLTISGWYDLFVAQALQHVAELRREADSETARRNQFLVVGPWGHGPNAMVGDRAYGSSASIEFDQIQRRWFDHWLKDRPSDIEQWPALRLFVMGRNQWRDESYWPLEHTQWTRYFFHSGGRANTLDGDGILNRKGPGDEPADRFVYDPDDPVPTRGGALLFGPGGARDQQQIEQRNDVLVYTSPPLTAELEVTGPIRVVLYAASDARDTDWTAKLVDVDPDGRAWNLCDGIIRARYRESTEKATLLTPGKVYRYEIDLWATSNAFLPGHRIRVEISSSNFPRFNRNPNTGHAFGADAQLRKAQQVVYHDADRPSHILLPIIPGDSVPNDR